MKQPTDARRAALYVLNQLVATPKTLDAVIENFDREFEIKPKDRSLANAVIFGIIRHRLLLDTLIAAFSKTPINKIDPQILNILRIGAFQIRFLDRVPVSAAVNTSVEMTKEVSGRWVAGFVNALLRRMARKNETVLLPDPVEKPAKSISIRNSFPEWLVRRWISRYGTAETENLCRHFNTVPPITVRANCLKTDRETLKKILAEQAENAASAVYVPDGIRFSRPGRPIEQMPSFKEGFFQVQDEASQIVALMLNPKPGETVLDACAGLGGKTGHIGQMMNSTGRIVAMDHDSRKLDKLRKEMNRLSISVVETLCVDILKQRKIGEMMNRFDRVLVDAPCSGSGVIRRNPDIKWGLKKKKLKKHHEEQFKILDLLSGCVKPGGFLGYSVCSIEPEETESVAERFLKQHDEFAVQCNYGFLSEPVQALINESGYLKTVPHLHDIDGFFCVIFKKYGSD